LAAVSAAARPVTSLLASVGIFRLGWVGVVILVVLGALRFYMWSKERRG
jgi:hypothetical protein